jgi:hypothetical protein
MPVPSPLSVGGSTGGTPPPLIGSSIFVKRIEAVDGADVQKPSLTLRA